MTALDRSRRTFVSGALLLAANPRVVVAQAMARKVRFVYIADSSVHSNEARPGEANFLIVQNRLGERGYAAGRNLEGRHLIARLDDGGLKEVLREAIAWAPDVLMVEGTSVSRAALNATATVPIVFVNVGDPLRSGLVASMARPGANATGVTTHNVILYFKRLELVRELLPQASRVGVFWDRTFEYYPGFHDEYLDLARRLRLEVIEGDISRHRGELGEAVKVIERVRPDAVTRVNPWPSLRRPDPGALLVGLQERLGIPCVGDSPNLPGASALLASMGAVPVDHFRRGADVAVQVFLGRKPSDIPVDQETRVLLQVNLQTARKLGIRIPKAVLLRADKVIE